MVDCKAKQSWVGRMFSYNRAEHFLCPLIEEASQFCWGGGVSGKCLAEQFYETTSVS